jgi:hypothetical protein
MLVSIFAKAPTKPMQHLSVKRLRVSFIRHDPNWMEKLDQLLSLLPNIERIFIEICIIQIDFEQFSRILKQRLIHLCYFECEIHAVAIPIRFTSVQRYHPLFQNIHLEDVDEEDCQCGGLKLCLNGKKKE